MSLLLITATAAITITAAACAATSTAGAIRTVDDIITAVATASQIESGDLSMSGYQGS